MADRDPHAVLGIERGATQAQIKAAWRRLAREHHPDLTGKDPGSVRAATRRMAQINAAYERLREGADAKRRRAGDSSTEAAPDGRSADLGGRKRRGGPPPPKPSRPVTGRLDTSGTFRGRNRTTTPRGSRAHASTEPPPTRPPAEDREPPRASDPTGPLRRGRIHRFRRAPLPDLSAANAVEMEFGKFRGHTLGQVAAFEPSYVDWLARTITRDPELVAAARVVQADLDDRLIPRREHVAPAAAVGTVRTA